MRDRILIAVLMTASVGACSEPSSDGPRRMQAARQIDLPEPPPADGAVASPLESGQTPKPAPTRAARRRVATVTAGTVAPAEAAHHHDVVVTEAPVPALRVSTTAVGAGPVLESPTRIPAAASPEAAPQPGQATEPRGHPEHVTRGPTIIIRGGMGGVHDDCDLRNHGQRGGAAVNRLAPSFAAGSRGGMSTGFRGGIR